MSQGQMDLLPEASVLLAERLLVGAENEALVLENPTGDAVGRCCSAASRSTRVEAGDHLIVIDRLLEIGMIKVAAVFEILVTENANAVSGDIDVADRRMDGIAADVCRSRGAPARHWLRSRTGASRNGSRHRCPNDSPT